MKALIVGLGIAAMAVGTSAAQPSSEARITHDIRCMALMGPEGARMARDPNRRVQAYAHLMEQGAAYYLGRVEALTPVEAIVDRMSREVASMKGKDLKAEAAQCRAEVRAVKDRMDKVGAELKRNPPPEA